MPFTVDQFFDVFGRYNAAIWPPQWVLGAMAIIAVIAVKSGADATPNRIKNLRPNFLCADRVSANRHREWS